VRPRVANEESKAVDLRVLRAMQRYPDVTSVRRLREILGLKTERVNNSVARILQRSWARAGKRNHPYEITEAGITILSERRT
jgi:hypothetical protein